MRRIPDLQLHLRILPEKPRSLFSCFMSWISAPPGKSDVTGNITGISAFCAAFTCCLGICCSSCVASTASNQWNCCNGSHCQCCSLHFLHKKLFPSYNVKPFTCFLLISSFGIIIPPLPGVCLVEIKNTPSICCLRYFSAEKAKHPKILCYILLLHNSQIIQPCCFNMFSQRLLRQSAVSWLKTL